MGYPVYVTGLMLLSVILCCQGQTVLKATVNMAGIKGDVTFSQITGGATTVTFALTSLTGTWNWEIRQNWVDLTVQHKCGNSVIGSRYMDSVGGTVSTGSETTSISASALSDVKMLLGRSVLLTKASDKACGTLNLASSAGYKTARVLLQGEVSGEVWLRQAANGMPTELLTDLFQTSLNAATTYTWKIYDGSSTDCKTLSSTYNPTSSTSSGCSASNMTACPVGNLSSKLGNSNVGQTSGSARNFYHDFNLPLFGDNSIFQKYLVILDNTNSIISCSMIMEVDKRQGMALFYMDLVTGPIQLSQESPFHPTKVATDIINLRNLAGGYHVHLYPVPPRVMASDSVCSGDSVGGHFNPFGIDTSVSVTDGTNDQYEVGDLSGKFGSMASKDNLSLAVEDYNLPMFGPNSIMGRSLVIHKDEGGTPRWVCTNIVNHSARTFAVATFKYPVIGRMIFSQLQDDPLSDTWIYSELNYNDGLLNPTSGHKWNVHVNKVGDDALETSGRCSTAGEIYDPFTVSTANYASECLHSNPLRCKVGDGSRLAGTLSIRKSALAPARKFFTTRNMPLSGPNSIVGRSVVIHAADGAHPALACANIIHVRRREARVDVWSSSVSGYIKFSQEFGALNDRTVINGNLTQLGRLAGGYHIHKFPVPDDDNSPCVKVGGHYNPFAVDPVSSPAPGSATSDKYEVGDLSGKYGPLTNKTSVETDHVDNMVTLFGKHAIVDRSIVIHKSADGSRWSCGTIQEDVSQTGGVLHRAKAMLNGELSGWLILTQYVYPDGSMSDTSVFLDIKYTDARAATTGHTFGINQQPVWGDRKSSLSTRCATAGQQYNPFLASKQTGYEECAVGNPFRCAVGDLSGKLGTYGVGSGKMFETDVNLDLVGKYTVVGRSVVVGAANGGSSRLGCAVLLPVNAPNTSVEVFKPDGATMVDIASKYAATVMTHTWNVIVAGDDTKSGCMSIKVYFLGKDAASLRDKFNSIVSRGGNSAMDVYKPVTCGAGPSSISLLFLALAWFTHTILA